MGAKFYKEGALKAGMFCLHDAYIKPARRAFMHSIKKTKVFKLVYGSGRQAVNPFFVMYVRKNDDDISRLGVTVSKKVGNAVIRNRVRRLVKESCRLRAFKIIKGYDIVIVARKVVGTLPREESFYKVDKSLEQLFRKLQLISPEEI